MEACQNAKRLSRSASAEELAATINVLLDVPPADPTPLPTRDDCVRELLELYQKVLKAGPG